MRIAAVALPQLSIECAFELEDPGRGLLAVWEGAAPGRLRQVSGAAGRAGLRVGMGVPAAQARVAGLRVRPRDPARELERLSAAAELLMGFGPNVQLCPEGRLLVELGASARWLRWRLGGGEPEAVAAIQEGLGRLGHRCAVAIAGDSATAQTLAAWVAARPEGGPGSWIVPPGGAREALAGLPISALVWGAGAPALGEAAERLAQLGVQRAGELAGLSAAGLSARLRAAGAELRARARAQAGQPLTPFQPSERPVERVELGAPVETLESALLALRALFTRLQARLAARGLVCAAVGLELLLEPGMHEGIDADAPRPRCSRRVHRLQLRFARPTREAKTMLTVVREQLSQRLPGAVIGLQAEALLPSPGAGAQLELFSARPTQLEASGAVIGRLQAMFGPQAVITPALADRHRPEAAWRPARFDVDRALGPPPPPPRRALPKPRRDPAPPPIPRVPLPLLAAQSVVGPGAPGGLHAAAPPPAPGVEAGPRVIGAPGVEDASAGAAGPPGGRQCGGPGVTVGVGAEAPPAPGAPGGAVGAAPLAPDGGGSGGRGAWPKPVGRGVEPRPARPPRPLTLLDPPEPARLGPGGLRWRGRWLPAQVQGRERLWGEWWTATPLDREYRVVALEDGRRLWVFAGEGGDFVHGVFD